MFGEVEAATPDAVVTNWEQIKKDEKGHESLVEGITPGLPSLHLRAEAAAQGELGGTHADLAGAGVGVDAGETVADDDALGAALAALAAAGARARPRRRIGAASLGRPVQGPVRTDGAARGAAQDVDLTTADAAVVRGLWDRAA